MKPILANRVFQWVLVLAFGLAITTAVSSALGPVRNPAVTSLAEEPSSSDSLSSEIPKPPENKSAPALSNRIVEYHMAVALQPGKKMLQGAQTVTWQNPGAKPVSELYFHLYPNAFSSRKTTFMRESGGKLRNDKQRPDSYGRMTLLTLKTAQGDDLLTQTAYVRPDDGNGDDQTLLRVTLPQPVMPGGKITLSMDYNVKLPFVFARMGYADDFYMAGQWFPKLAKYETAGMRGREEEGWNLHQYHGNSEFYADFGIYDVKIKVPSDFTVAATGFPTKPAVTDKGSKTYRFYADDVHDFAWAASPHFVYVEEPFSAPGVPGVKIKLYLDPQHKHLKTRYLAAVKKSLSRYSEWYGTYPYSTLSVVVPPGNGNGAGGMEYPTLITAWGAAGESPDLELERVVVHEIGHQYWYGMVASNEFEEAWLDEGFTSYAEDKVMEKEYGVKPSLPFESSYVTQPEPLKRNAWDFGGHGPYADNVYTRAKLVLHAIEKDVGSDTMNRVLRSYFQRWKFKHPGTADFQKTLETVTGKDWQAFFDQFVYGGQMVDYVVNGIRVKKSSADGKPVYENQVVISKRGAQSPEVPIRFKFSDGTVIDKTWDSQGSEIVYTLEHTSPLEWVMIDPDYTLILENKHINNFMKTSIDNKWNVRLNVSASKILEILSGLTAW